MVKQYDKQTLAKDYIAQVEWENNHPLDKRGRPSWRFQPQWKYKKVYPRTSRKTLLLVFVLIAISLAFVGFLMNFLVSVDPKVGIATLIMLLSLLAIIYFITRKPK